jgi:hypothetical protein
LKFELTDLPRNCPDETLIEEVRRVGRLVDKPILTREDFDRLAKVTSARVTRRFGSWARALDAAGLSHKYSGVVITDSMLQQPTRGLSADVILAELRRVADKLGRAWLTADDLREHSRLVSISTVRYRFGSWPAGLRQASLKTSPGYRRRYTDQEYFENILTVWTHLGRQPAYDDLRRTPSRISPEAYVNRFGTWRRALELFVQTVSTTDGCVTDQEATSVAVDALTSPDSPATPPSPEFRRQVPLGLRYRILKRDCFRCVKCGATPATDPQCQLEVDHKVPVALGGRTVPENLQTLCHPCNSGKGCRDVD